ncbi:hypothetical protein KUTeg_012373 [Tegillarca granosa]|uniref:Uncharacterized protein n=1 Tax=Tegillarca granosa TaxID=220873 RepID=A0ABQ9EZC2_TEGGR|nr:hypothetical protein KUTeg_012373 [Tegillarca granosa]
MKIQHCTYPRSKQYESTTMKGIVEKYQAQRVKFIDRFNVYLVLETDDDDKSLSLDTHLSLSLNASFLDLVLMIQHVRDDPSLFSACIRHKDKYKFLFKNEKKIDKNP